MNIWIQESGGCVEFVEGEKEREREMEVKKMKWQAGRESN